MPDKVASARTMRIDIRPDGSQAGDSSATGGLGSSAKDPTSFVAARDAAAPRSADYQELLESIYDAVVITDGKGRVVDFNSRTRDFFLCAGDELVGTSVIDLISGADETLLSAIKKNLKDHRYTLIEAGCRRRNGTTFPAEIAVNQVMFNAPPELCFFIRDITVRKKAQEGLESAVARLQEHDRARSDFVSNVSHELRTPLTSMIYAVANMLRGVVGPLPERVRGYLEMLDGDCHRLLATVDDILDLRKIESQDLYLARAKVPFGHLVGRSVESLRVQARQKGLQLTVSLGKRNWFVECDPQKMERVLLNIVGNAIKFTPKGGCLHVGVRVDPAREGRVMVAIRDDGVGIPAADLPKVTLRYFTVGEQSSGSGLGLAMAREIVALHGGDLDIQSPPVDADRGTVVCVSLPAVEAPLVLVVDDSDAVRNLLAQQIEGRGYRVAHAVDGGEAMETLKTIKPEVVVLDLVLPRLPGTAVILRMKSDKALAQIPILVITGAALGKGKAEILRRFSIPVLSKPWREADLLNHVAGAFFGDIELKKHPILKIDEAAYAKDEA